MSVSLLPSTCLMNGELIDPNRSVPTLVWSMYKRHPFLRNYIPEKNVKHSYPIELNPVVLQHSPDYQQANNGDMLYEQVFILDGNGRKVIQTTTHKYIAPRFLYWGKKEKTTTISWGGEVTTGVSIESTLKRMPDRLRDVRFLVSYIPWFKLLQVTKIPQEVSLCELLNNPTE